MLDDRDCPVFVHWASCGGGSGSPPIPSELNRVRDLIFVDLWPRVFPKAEGPGRVHQLTSSALLCAVRQPAIHAA